MKNRALKISLVILVALVLSVVLLLSIVKVGERLLFVGFFANAETAFKVPGIADGFIQQGFDFYEGNAETDEDDRFLVSGYMKDGSASRVYVLDKDGNVLNYTKLTDKAGQNYTGHAGGIAHNGAYLYITNDDNDENSINVFSLASVLDDNQESAKLQGSIYVYLKPAFCYIHEGKLYTGNFHRDGHEKYKSPDEFNLGTEENTAMMLSFELNSTVIDNYGVSKTPSEAYSITSQVQGMCVANGKLVLSTSWGLNPSHLYIYDFEKINTRGTIPTSVFTSQELYGEKAMAKPIPLHIITDDDLEKEVTAPPMAEEMVYYDGNILVMNESASAKYIFGRFTSGNNVYGYIFD